VGTSRLLRDRRLLHNLDTVHGGTRQRIERVAEALLARGTVSAEDLDALTGPQRG
jgi:hypothetical protein